MYNVIQNEALKYTIAVEYENVSFQFMITERFKYMILIKRKEFSLTSGSDYISGFDLWASAIFNLPQ